MADYKFRAVHCHQLNDKIHCQKKKEKKKTILKNAV